MRRALGWVVLAVGCAGREALPPARAVEAHVAVVDVSAALPDDHPAVLAVEPTSSADHVGRAPRRLSVDQLRAALLGATGFTWVASRRVSDPESPSGASVLPDADMLEALASTLGRADYVTSTSDSTEPAVTFAKLAGDAARSACRAAVAADVSGAGERRILVRVSPDDTTSTRLDAVRANLAYLALRFWARRVEPDAAELTPLVTLFERAGPRATPPAPPAEGWRAVCIAMATDPQFLTY